jgi:hypothetical protein
MPPQQATFSIYIDPKIPEYPQNSDDSTDKEPPSKKAYIDVPKLQSSEEWLRQPLQSIAPNFARPTDPPFTLPRLPDRKVTLGSFKKWQKTQPNDHTSKLLI